MGEGESCGFRLIEDREGENELVLYYADKMPANGRAKFQELFEQFLYQREVEVTRFQPVIQGRNIQRRTAHEAGRAAMRGLVDVWHDRRIEAGNAWYKSIQDAMDDCDLSLLLVSPDHLASRFIQAEEQPKLLQCRQELQLRVIPIIVRPCVDKRTSAERPASLAQGWQSHNHLFKRHW